MSYVKVKDRPDLIRDTLSNAIINTNSDVVVAARMRKQHKNNIVKREEFNKVKDELQDIKNLLQIMINKLNERST